jgi:hypothetical protein
LAKGRDADSFGNTWDDLEKKEKELKQKETHKKQGRNGGVK